MNRTGKALLAVGITIGVTASLLKAFLPPQEAIWILALTIYGFSAFLFIGLSLILQEKRTTRILGILCCGGYAALIALIVTFYFHFTPTKP